MQIHIQTEEETSNSFILYNKLIKTQYGSWKMIPKPQLTKLFLKG